MAKPFTSGSQTPAWPHRVIPTGGRNWGGSPPVSKTKGKGQPAKPKGKIPDPNGIFKGPVKKGPSLGVGGPYSPGR